MLPVGYLGNIVKLVEPAVTEPLLPRYWLRLGQSVPSGRVGLLGGTWMALQL